MPTRLPEPTTVEESSSRLYLNQLIRVLRNSLTELENGVSLLSDRYGSTTTVQDTSYTPGFGELVVLVDDDEAGSEVVITLNQEAGRVIWVKKIGNTADVVIDTNSGSIEFTSNLTLTIQGEAVTLVSNGTDYFVI